jgi:hypothetical protein
MLERQETDLQPPYQLHRLNADAGRQMTVVFIIWYGCRRTASAPPGTPAVPGFLPLNPAAGPFTLAVITRVIAALIQVSRPECGHLNLAATVARATILII